MSLLIVAPHRAGDSVLANSRWIAEETTARAGTRRCTCLLDQRAHRGAIEAQQAAVDGIAFFGHGSSAALLGVDGDAAIDTRNMHLFRGRWIHALACHSAAGALLEHATAVGVRCFAGYDAAVILNWDPEQIPEEIYDGFSELVTIATFALSDGIFEEREVLRAVAAVATRIVAWCDANPEARCGHLEITAQQLVNRLLVRNGAASPD